MQTTKTCNTSPCEALMEYKKNVRWTIGIIVTVSGMVLGSLSAIGMYAISRSHDKIERVADTASSADNKAEVLKMEVAYMRNDITEIKGDIKDIPGQIQHSQTEILRALKTSP